MKYIKILILLLLIFVTGCQDDSSILSPNDDFSNDNLLKGRPILNNDLDNFKIITNDDLIDEDENKDNLDTDLLSKRENTLHEKLRVRKTDVKTKHSKVLTINSEKGGKVYLKHKWKNDKNQNSKLTAVLDIPAGAFPGELTFEILFDLENYAVELYPSPYKFAKPLLLDLVFENVDLTNFDPDVFVFDYLDGEQENIQYKSIDIQLDKNTVKVREAELNHFSRYGWTRTRISQ